MPPGCQGRHHAGCGFEYVVTTHANGFIISYDITQSSPEFLPFSPLPTHTQNPLVTSLVEGLLSSCQSTVQASCTALTSAALHGWVSRDSCLAAILSQVPSMVYYPVVVGGVREILMAELEGTLEVYTCPYSLR